MHHPASRLIQNTPPGADIPGPAPTLPVNVHLRSRHRRQVQSGGAQGMQGVNHRAAGLTAPCQLAECLNLVLVVWPIPRRPPLHRDKRIRETLQRPWVLCQGESLRRISLALCHEGALALDSCEEKVLVGVVDDANGGLAVDSEAEGNAGVGEHVEEVGGAVDGVNNEGGLRADFLAGFVCLFAHEGDIRVGSGEAVGDNLFDGLIDFGDDIGSY